MRKYAAALIGLLILAVVNLSIYHKEQVLAHGQTVYLALAPVDPRSLMQGDYMRLRFQLESEMASRIPNDRSQNADGYMIVSVNAQGVGELVRLQPGLPAGLASGQVAMRYRVREGQIKFASNAFFFQEGHADDYAHAKYGEFKVADDGELLLTDLRGEHLEQLGKAAL
jgi:uncharacterized membrane-anchored protein